MKVQKSILDYLNRILACELSAIDQYFIHARMYDDWGYQKLFERSDHEVTDEQEHAHLIISRILYLGGVPDIQTRIPVKIGKTVPEMLGSDLKIETHVTGLLKEAIEHCESKLDYGTSQILIKLLQDTEEDHTLWLEQQLNHIKTLGLDKYLMTNL
ncbi:MAG: bacterioferritin [Oligoflexales bacterium]